MTRSRNLFVVLSPLQLICAQEAREKFCLGEYNHLVIVNRNIIGSRDYKHKINELDEYWTKITEVSEPKNKGIMRFLIRIINTLIIFSRHGFSSGNVFLGDAYLNWFWLLGKLFGNEVTWLDDGASSINFLADFNARGFLNTPNKRTPKFFTIFASHGMVKNSNCAIVINNLEVFQRRRCLNQIVQQKSMIFIGQWLSERGGVDQDAEVAILQSLMKKYQGWDVRYISHRHESSIKLEKIKDFMKVVEFERSIESSLLASSEVPEEIVSWYSSALFTLKPLLPKTKFSALKVPLEYASERQASEWLCVYDALEGIGIQIIDPSSDW